MMEKYNIRKICIFILLIILCVLTIALPSFGYGQQVSAAESGYVIWWIPVDPLILPFNTGYETTARANYMIAGEYIGFHEISHWSKINEIPFTQYAYSDPSMRFYKNSSSLFAYSMYYDSNVWVAPNWVWDYHTGTAQGSLGQGSGTYTAQATAVFTCPSALYSSKIVNLTISFPSP